MSPRPGNFVTQLAGLGHRGRPPRIPTAFGVPRFSREQQATHPELPLTRIIKDVLPVGKWKVGHDQRGNPLLWEVTREQLQLIAEQFALAQSRGIAMNLTRSHGNLQTLIVPTDDLIAPIDQVVVENDVLWISAYVTPEEAQRLRNPAMKVSPGVTTRFEDGEGRRYPIMLYHTAVIDQPTVTNQGCFLALANKQPQGGNAMDEAILDLFRRLFEYAGSPLPETVTPDNAMELLPVLVDHLIGGEESDDETYDSGTEIDDPEGADQPLDTATMANAIRHLTRRLEAIETGSKKHSFESRVARLVSTGKIQAKSGVVLNNQAPAHGYNLSILDVFDHEPTRVPMGRRAVTLANAAPPSVGETKSKVSLEDRVNKLLGRKVPQK